MNASLADSSRPGDYVAHGKATRAVMKNQVVWVVFLEFVPQPRLIDTSNFGSAVGYNT
jgi:hypothetical protein